LTLSELKSYGRRKHQTLKYKFLKRFVGRTVTEDLADETVQNDSRLGSLIILPGAVHTRGQHRVCKTPYQKLNDADLSEQPWLQLICCAVYHMIAISENWIESKVRVSADVSVCCSNHSSLKDK